MRVDVSLSGYEGNAERWAHILTRGHKGGWVEEAPVKYLHFAGRGTSVPVSEVSVVAFLVNHEAVSANWNAYSWFEGISIFANTGLWLGNKLEVFQWIAEWAENCSVYHDCGYAADHSGAVLSCQMPSMALADPVNRTFFEVTGIAPHTSFLQLSCTLHLLNNFHASIDIRTTTDDNWANKTRSTCVDGRAELATDHQISAKGTGIVAWWHESIGGADGAVVAGRASEAPVHGCAANLAKIIDVVVELIDLADSQAQGIKIDGVDQINANSGDIICCKVNFHQRPPTIHHHLQEPNKKKTVITDERLAEGGLVDVQVETNCGWGMCCSE